jgi:hypothetical protein
MSIHFSQKRYEVDLRGFDLSSIDLGKERTPVRSGGYSNLDTAVKVDERPLRTRERHKLVLCGWDGRNRVLSLNNSPDRPGGHAQSRLNVKSPGVVARTRSAERIQIAKRSPTSINESTLDQKPSICQICP